MNSGLMLKMARQKAGLTQDELGAQVEVSGQYIGKLERGEAKNPSRAIIKRISEVLDIPFESLLYGSDAREGVTEQDILLARAIRDLPSHYQIEISALVIRGQHEAILKKEQKTPTHC